GRNTPAHEVYDPAANRWTALAYVPTARDHLAAAAMDGRLYAVGGRIDGNYSRNLASNEAYDPATGRWEQRAPLPTARSGIAAAGPGGAAAWRRGSWGGGCWCAAGRPPPAPSTRRKPMIPGATAGAAKRVCRRRDMVSAQPRSRAGFTSSRVAQDPATRRRRPMRFSCRKASRAADRRPLRWLLEGLILRTKTTRRSALA